MKSIFYWDSKAVFCQIYDLYFVKDLIQGFSLVMKFELQQGNEA